MERCVVPGQLPALLEAAGLRHSDQVALVDGARSMSFGELRRAGLTVRARLLAAGVRDGDTIAIQLRNSEQHVVALLGSIYAGTTIVPISDRLTEAEIGYILSDSGAVALLHDSDATGGPGEGVQREIITISIDETFLLTDRRLGEVEADLDRVQSSFLPYTSGTTGRPKGVDMPAASRGVLVSRLIEHYDFGGHDILLASLPLAHSAGLTFVLAHLVAGGKVVLSESAFSPDGLAITARRHSATTILLVPTMMEALARSDVPPSKLTSVRRWVVTGSPLSPEARSKFTRTVPVAPIWQYYGATESPHMTLLRPDDGERRPTSVGRPFADVQLQIRDDDAQPVAVGEDGEIWARSPWMLDSYHNNPTSTADALRNGWYRTGDLGHLDAEGYLFVTGRKRDVIISGGLNIYPAEVESVLRSHPAVVDSAVVGLSDRYWGEKVVAVVRCSAPVGPNDIIEHCRTYLASYKKPTHVLFVSDLPRNHLGKLDKKALTTFAMSEFAAADEPLPRGSN